MNFTKNLFTPEQIVDMPVFETKQEAPFGVPFFLLEQHKQQKEHLLNMMEQMEPDKFKEMIENTGAKIHIEYWIKYKDGNVGVRGGSLISSAPLMIKIGD